MARRLAGLLLGAILGLSVTVPLRAEVASHWEKLAPLPTARQNVGVAAIDDAVYVVGGIDSEFAVTGALDRYSTTKGEWFTLEPLPDGTRLFDVGAVAVEGKLFVIGGLDPSLRGVRSVFCYDPTVPRWEPKTDLPWPRGAMAVATIGSDIYVAGGRDDRVVAADAAVYRTSDDRWDPLPPLSSARQRIAGVALDGLFYVAGGHLESGQSDAFEAFDPQSQRWYALAAMPRARAGVAAAVLDDLIYIFGGETSPEAESGVFPEVDVYDPCRNRWFSEQPMETPRHAVNAAVVEDRIHLPGGATVIGFNATDVHDAFVPAGTGRGEFLRGDANRDGNLDLSDSVSILSVLFLSGGVFPCEDAADLNDDGAIILTDAIFGLNYLFLGGPRPPPPGPGIPGTDPTDDDLECVGDRVCSGPIPRDLP